MNGKAKFAMYWAASCGGCDIAVLNVNELLLDFDREFEVVFWPAAMDAKYADLRAMADRSIDLALVSGSLRNSENEEIVRLLRAKTKTLVAFGSCAGEGCIPGLANLFTVGQIFDASYRSPSVDKANGIVPREEWMPPTEGRVRDGEVLTLPRFEPLLRPIDRVVAVDYYVPGCPPESTRVAEVLQLVIAALHGRAELPPAGSVIGAGN